MVRPPDCDPAAGDCGSSAAWLFFFLFYVAVGMIAMQLFVSVILVRWALSMLDTRLQLAWCP